MKGINSVNMDILNLRWELSWNTIMIMIKAKKIKEKRYRCFVEHQQKIKKNVKFKKISQKWIV